MNTPFDQAANGSVTGLPDRIKGAMGRALQRLSPRQRQYVTLAAILICGVGLLWLIFALTDTHSPTADAKNNGNAQPATVTNIGVMPPGQQVNPVDQWVGTAGRKLAQYENERDEQTRLNKDRQAFEARTMQRFAELEQKTHLRQPGCQHALGTQRWGGVKHARSPNDATGIQPAIVTTSGAHRPASGKASGAECQHPSTFAARHIARRRHAPR